MIKRKTSPCICSQNYREGETQNRSYKYNEVVICLPGIYLQITRLIGKPILLVKGAGQLDDSNGTFYYNSEKEFRPCCAIQNNTQGAVKVWKAGLICSKFGPAGAVPKFAIIFFKIIYLFYVLIKPYRGILQSSKLEHLHHRTPICDPLIPKILGSSGLKTITCAHWNLGVQAVQMVNVEKCPGYEKRQWRPLDTGRGTP